MRRTASREEGFTLLEVLMVIIVMGIMAGTLSHFFSFWNSVGTKTHRQLNTQHSLEEALNRIVDGSSLVPGLLGAKSIDTASGNTLEYTTVDDQTVTYTLSGTDLNRSYGGTTDTIISNVSAFTVASSSSVELSLSAIVTGVGGDRTISVSTTVRPRNVE